MPMNAASSRKRLWAVLSGSMLVLAILFAVALGRGGEPSYGGRSLGSWLRVPHNPKSIPAQQQLAQDAIRAMGTNVVPSLLMAMDASATGFLAPFVGLGQRLGLRYRLPMHLAWSKAGLLRLSIGYLDEPTRREAVRVLFQSYVQERLPGNANDQSRQQNLANAMFSCGDCFLEFLAGALTNAQPDIRTQAASLVGFRNTPTNFIGVLAERLSDPVPGVRWQAVTSLARFRKQHATVVPLLSRGLEDSDAAVRRAAVQCLQRFGPQARSALPSLKALAERDRENRRFILDCVRAIDWEEGEHLAGRLKK
jgi:HEAT repeats